MRVRGEGVGLMALVALLPGSLRAQEADTVRLRDLKPDEIERVEVRRLDDGEGIVRILTRSNRGRLGIKVSLQAQPGDSIGATVDAVTPGGPAAKAGITSGDIITKLDGASLLSGRTRAPADRDESLPGLRLVERAAQLKGGEQVTLEYRRGRETRTTTLTTNADEDRPRMGVRRFGPGDRDFVFLGPEGRGDIEVRARELAESLRRDFGAMRPLPRGAFEFRMDRGIGGLELAPLNPDLGAYFGAKEGVLVISVPRESGLGLRGGDVVLSADGRAPGTPSHLMRILRSYERGETVKLEILRNRKRETVSGKIDG